MKLFEIENTDGILPIGSNDIEDSLNLAVNEFGGYEEGGSDQVASHINKNTDWNISKKLVVNGKLAGIYLLRPGNIIDTIQEEPNAKVFVDLENFANKRGVEGIALVVLPEYRRRGFGDKLKSIPRNLGFDYVYGQQLKSLGNLRQWLRRRQLVADVGDTWITAEIF